MKLPLLLHSLYIQILTEKVASDDDGILDFDAMWDLALNKAPIEFFIIHTRKEGNTFRESYFGYIGILYTSSDFLTI